MLARAGAVGMDRVVKLAWLDATLERVATGDDPSDVRAFLNGLLAGQVAGDDVHSARGKTITILLHLWVLVPPHLRPLRDHAVALSRHLPPVEHLWLHWGMALATYPFFAGAASTVGRLLELQGSVTRAQLRRRLTETWGQRSTVERASNRVIQSFANWGVLVPTGEPGAFGGAARRALTDQELGAWMLEAALHASGASSSPYAQLVSSPALFPFALRSASPWLRANGRLEFYRQGLDQTVVALRR